MARDVFHQYCAVIGPSACRFKVLELGASDRHRVADGAAGDDLPAMFTARITARDQSDRGRWTMPCPHTQLTSSRSFSDRRSLFGPSNRIDVTI